MQPEICIVHARLIFLLLPQSLAMATTSPLTRQELLKEAHSDLSAKSPELGSQVYLICQLLTTPKPPNPQDNNHHTTLSDMSKGHAISQGDPYVLGSTLRLCWPLQDMFMEQQRQIQELTSKLEAAMKEKQTYEEKTSVLQQVSNRSRD